jgi:hypothetical protein
MLVQAIFWNRIFANIERYAMYIIIIEGKYNHNHDENNNNTLIMIPYLIYYVLSRYQ